MSQKSELGINTKTRLVPTKVFTKKTILVPAGTFKSLYPPNTGLDLLQGRWGGWPKQLLVWWICSGTSFLPGLYLSLTTNINLSHHTSQKSVFGLNMTTKQAGTKVLRKSNSSTNWVCSEDCTHPTLIWICI
jgi:hypothetical protein